MDNEARGYRRLPAELVKRVVDFLAGAWVTTFENEFDYYDDEPLLLTKHEASRCSLTCRYWARSLRSRVVGGLTLRSREDAEALLSFARSNVCGRDLHIAPRVQNVQVRCKSSDIPWLHLLFLSRDLFPRTNVIYMQMTMDESPHPRSARSFNALLPRDFPPSLMTITSPDVEIKHPVRIEDITSLICSARPFNSKAWPAPNLDRALPHQWTFRKVSILPPSPEAALNAMPRSYIRKTTQTVNLEHCPHPWLFPRTFVSTRRPRRTGAESSAFFINPQELKKLEDILQYISESGCQCPQGAAYGHEMFKLQFLCHGDITTGFSLTFTCECRKNILGSSKFAISALGAISHVEITVQMRDMEPSSTAEFWRAIDERVARFDGLKTVAVCFPAHIVTAGLVEANQTVVFGNMAEITRDRRLELYSDDPVKGHIRIFERQSSE